MFGAVMMGIGAATTAYDMYQGNKAQGKADRLNRQSQGRYQAMLERYNQYYQPLDTGVLEQLGNGPDLEGAAARARANFQDEYGISTAQKQRQMMQYGINPGSQRAVAGMEDDAYNRAAGSASAANIARRQESDSDWAKRVSMMGYGQQQQGMALSGLAGEQAYAQQAADSYMQSAGAGMGMLGEMGGQYFSAQTKTAKTPTGLDKTGIDPYASPAQNYSPAGQSDNYGWK